MFGSVDLFVSRLNKRLLDPIRPQLLRVTFHAYTTLSTSNLFNFEFLPRRSKQDISFVFVDTFRPSNITAVVNHAYALTNGYDRLALVDRNTNPFKRIKVVGICRASLVTSYDNCGSSARQMITDRIEIQEYKSLVTKCLIVIEKKV